MPEDELNRLEQRRDPGSVPQLVDTIRQQQHELDSLRLGLEVARRDREELRLALLAARAEIERMRAPQAAAARHPSNRDES